MHQFPIRKSFGESVCIAAFGNQRCLWGDVMLAVHEGVSHLGNLLEVVVHKDLEQANRLLNYQISLKSRELIQLVAPDTNPEHFKRRVVAISENHPGMGHPVSFSDEGLKLLRIEEHKLVPLTAWEIFLAEHEDELVNNNGTWRFFESIREAWQLSPLNKETEILTDVDWHLPNQQQGISSVEELDIILAALDQEQALLLSKQGRTGDPKIPTPANSPEPAPGVRSFKPN